MRILDGKFLIEMRNGEQEIVKASNGEVVPRDEPLFVLRARDHLALPLLKIYEQLSIVDGCNDFHLDGLDGVLKRFESYRAQYPERMKQPGVTRGR